MKVLLISANTETINMPIIPVGLGAIAAATLNAGHDVNLIDLMSVDDARLAVKEAIGEFEPDVVGISVRNIDDQNFLKPYVDMGVDAIGTNNPMVLIKYFR